MENKNPGAQDSTQVQLKDYEIPIGSNYILDARKKLGEGSFGYVFYGYSKKYNLEVAIKLEPKHKRKHCLHHECEIYMVLQKHIGIPVLHYCGSQGNYNVLIIDLLGHSLEDYFNKCKRKFTLLTTLMAMEQMLSLIEYIHNRKYIHRDIKPDNFLFGRGDKKNQLHLIDFGLSNRYRNLRTELHIPYKDGKSFVGNSRFASINTHLGIEQSRRDDIEGLGYILVYFMKGKLPWQGLKANNHKEKYEKVKQKKMEISLDTLCQGLPDEFKTFIQYARDLKFEDCPDYSYLKKLIIQICEKNQLTLDYNKFDWNLQKKEDNSSNEQKEDNNKENNRIEIKNKYESKPNSPDKKKE